MKADVSKEIGTRYEINTLWILLFPRHKLYSSIELFSFDSSIVFLTLNRFLIEIYL